MRGIHSCWEYISHFFTTHNSSRGLLQIISKVYHLLLLEETLFFFLDPTGSIRGAVVRDDNIRQQVDIGNAVPGIKKSISSYICLPVSILYLYCHMSGLFNVRSL